MERSNYESFMECMRSWEEFGRNLVCGAVLLERISACWEHDIPITELDASELAQEAERRLMLMHGELYAYAMSDWIGQQYSRNTDTSIDAAGENGCNFSTQNKNSS